MLDAAPGARGHRSIKQVALISGIVILYAVGLRVAPVVAFRHEMDGLVACLLDRVGRTAVFRSTVRGFALLLAIIGVLTRASVIAASAAAGDVTTVTVTNATDAVNGDTSSVSALQASPGPDGISLREAIMAANNTQGPKLIRFDPSLKGKSIRVGDGFTGLALLPVLSSGSLTIDGDVDGDGIADITIDGSRGAGPGFVVRSSGNTLTHLIISGFPGSAVTFSCPDTQCAPKYITGNRILANRIESAAGNTININPLGLLPYETSPLLSGLVWENTEISDNLFVMTADPAVFTADTVIALRPGAGGGHNNRISGTKILRNRITGTGRAGINIGVGDETSHELGGTSPEVYSDGNTVEDTTISANDVSGMRFQAIVVQCADSGNQNNRAVRTTITANQIAGPGTDFGVGVFCGEGTDAGNDVRRPTAGNAISTLLIQGNRITGVRMGIWLAAGGKPGPSFPNAAVLNNLIEDVTIDGNAVSSATSTGIGVHGGDSFNGEAVTGNVARRIAITRNQVTSTPNAIDIVGGWSYSHGPSTQNAVQNLTLTGNRVDGSVVFVGGRGDGARGNTVGVTAVTGAANAVDNQAGAAGNAVTVTASNARCATSTGAVEQRIAEFWGCVGLLGPLDVLAAEDLGQWARNVIERAPAAVIRVGAFRSSTAAMQNALDRASAGVAPLPPKTADVESRIAAFWQRVSTLGPCDSLTATDLGQWALNVIDRDPSRRVFVEDFQRSTAGMQAALDSGDSPCSW